LRIALGEGEEQIHPLSFSKFCTTYQLNGMQAYSALNALDRFSVISLSQGYHRRCSLRFCESGTKIIHFTQKRPVANAIVQAILRTYGSSKNQELQINTALVATRSNTSEELVNETLQLLHQQELIEVTIMNTDLQITYLIPRDDERTINRFSRELERQNALRLDKLKALVQLVTNTDSCINRLLLAYFDEETHTDCGHCSNCKKPKESENRLDQVLILLKREPLDSNQISLLLKEPKGEVIAHLKLLLEQSKVIITNNNKYKIND
jgi:ATP-dependent DNA helicase RecQ